MTRVRNAGPGPDKDGPQLEENLPDILYLVTQKADADRREP